MTRTLGSTGIATSPLGIGCATLYHEPSSRVRLSIMTHALDSGIRHFDAAPIYGLGLAEVELGRFIARRRSEMTISTKFGFGMTRTGAAIGRAQAPIRAILKRAKGAGDTLRSSGRSADSGPVGKVLYRHREFTPEQARKCLGESLSRLRTDYIDIFLIHDPGCISNHELRELATYLDSEIVAGRIRSWGPAGLTAEALLAKPSWQLAPTIQFPHDFLAATGIASFPAMQAKITFGALSRVLRVARDYLDSHRRLKAEWSRECDVNLEDPSVLSALLIKHALADNHGGVVLVGTSKLEHVEWIAESAAVPMNQGESELVRGLRGKLIASGYGGGETK